MIVGSVNWDYWFDELRPSFAGIENEIVVQQIRAAAIDFCELSFAWRYETEGMTVNAGNRKYTINPYLDDTEIVRVEQAFISGKKLTVTSLSGLMQRNANYSDSKGPPAFYVQDYTESLSLYPMPSNTIVKGLYCIVSLRPSRIALGMNDSVGKRYFDAIAHGAKARLFEIPAKPWSDVNLSAYHRTKFTTMATSARDSVASGYGLGSKRVVSHL